ncbi:MAG: right-handed parallel beta-helix repeat-containing protein [Clostridia bacterium]|nr:right-handed parallel beta-helix repeat-containing protein [Clostridia bacterium]
MTKAKKMMSFFLAGMSVVFMFVFLCASMNLNGDSAVSAKSTLLLTSDMQSDENGAIVIEDVTFSGGDKIFVNTNQEVTIKNCTFVGTTSSAIVVECGTVNIVNSTIQNSRKNGIDVLGDATLNILGHTRIFGNAVGIFVESGTSPTINLGVSATTVASSSGALEQFSGFIAQNGIGIDSSGASPTIEMFGGTIGTAEGYAANDRAVVVGTGGSFRLRGGKVINHD